MMDSARKSRGLVGLAGAIAALVAGCANLDPTPIFTARAAVDAASVNSNVGESSLDLEEAQRHLARAEQALNAGRYQDIVDHEALMATRYAEVAVVAGEARLAREAAQAFLDQAVVDADVTRLEVGYALARARALDAMQTERGLVLTLGGVNFAFDSAELKPEGRLAAARVAGFLIAANNREVLVEGYSDDQGTEEYNLGLSRRRAEALAAALIANGVSPARIAADGFGPAFPVASNADDEGRASNRRVEVIILEPGLLAAQERRSGGLPGVAAGPE
jgi:outer membrane protein OmpA-like peptidoglycan-associated protein